MNYINLLPNSACAPARTGERVPHHPPPPPRGARKGPPGPFLFGFAGAAVSPFLPVVAIRELGMPEHAARSPLTFAAAVANVLASVAIGLLADRRAGYRGPLLAASALGAAGYATVWLLPSALTLALVLVGPLAAYNASNALIFAKVGRAPEFTPAEAHGVRSPSSG